MKPKTPRIYKEDKKAESYTDWDLSRIAQLKTALIHKKCGYYVYTGGYGMFLYCWECHKTINNDEAVNKEEWDELQPERNSMAWLDW